MRAITPPGPGGPGVLGGRHTWPSGVNKTAGAFLFSGGLGQEDTEVLGLRRDGNMLKTLRSTPSSPQGWGRLESRGPAIDPAHPWTPLPVGSWPARRD